MESLVIFRVDYKSREMPKPRNIVRAKVNALKVSFNRYFSRHGISWEKHLSKRSFIKHIFSDVYTFNIFLVLEFKIHFLPAKLF